MRLTPSTIHAAFEYILTKAVLEGKVGDTVIHVPLTDFKQPDEGPEFEEDARDLVLRIDLKTSWENADDVEEMIATNIEDEQEEEEDGEEGSAEDAEGNSDKDSESH